LSFNAFPGYRAPLGAVLTTHRTRILGDLLPFLTRQLYTNQLKSTKPLVATKRHKSHNKDFS